MLILAVDSSTPVSTVALADQEKLIAELFYNTNKTHSQRLMPMIDNMLKETGLTIRDVEGFAVAMGPGSFTGLRIGMATIKSLSHVLKKPLVGIPTLDALAYNVIGVEGTICPILNARKHEVYCALYEGKSMKRLTDYKAISPEKLLQILSEQKEPFTVLGDGVPFVRDHINESLDSRVNFVPATNNLPRAGQVGLLGARKLAKGECHSCYTLEPIYVRRSEAELRLERKKGRIEAK